MNFLQIDFQAGVKLKSVFWERLEPYEHYYFMRDSRGKRLMALWLFADDLTPENVAKLAPDHMLVDMKTCELMLMVEKFFEGYKSCTRLKETRTIDGKEFPVMYVAYRYRFTEENTSVAFAMPLLENDKSILTYDSDIKNILFLPCPYESGTFLKCLQIILGDPDSECSLAHRILKSKISKR